MQNLSRALVTLCAIIVSITLASKVDKFLGLLGSMLCAPLALTCPAILHLKRMAKTKLEKVFDVILIAVSLVILVFCSSQSIMNWDVETSGGH